MWTETENALTKNFKFKNFKEAFAFMTEVAIAAEELNHHPWWSNMYNVVEIKLNTHDAGNIVTPHDHALAERIDEIAKKFLGTHKA